MRTEFNLVVYKGIRRSATKDRVKPLTAVGVTSRLNEKQYLLFFDLDDSTPESLHAVLDVIRKYVAVYCCVLISETSKGYHVIVVGRYPWRFQNKLWKLAESYLDRKWVNLQRKRHKRMKCGAILRICGKYGYNDIRLLYEIPGNVCDEGLSSWVLRYKFWRSLCFA
ncbi:MAG: hypothetical protein QW521_03435 [Desulfurococcaceae archaeon]